MNGRTLPILCIQASLALAACGSDTTEPDDLNLEGLWLVTPATGTFYGSEGPTTLEFGSGSGGVAQFLSQSDANGITTCEGQIYAVIGAEVLVLDEEFYAVDAQSSDRIVLSNDDAMLTLDRVTGAPPVAPCGEATAVEVESFDRRAGGFTSLSAAGSRLYFNIEGGSDSIVAYDPQAGSLEAARAYTRSVLGGTHRWVVGARSNNLFYGHCGCGGSTSVDYFDLDSDVSINAVATDTDLGVNMSVRYGYFEGSNIVIGGQDGDDRDVNQLLTLDEATLALVSQRQILDEAFIVDVALRGSDLLALVGANIVVVRTDGRADQSFRLTGLANSFARGLATINNDVYVLASKGTGEAVLYQVILP